MKSSLKVLSLLLAISVPGALFAQFNGAHLPSTTDAGALFIAFVATLTILTIVSDYTRSPRRLRLPQARGSAHAEIIQLHAASAANRLAA
jgi:hypothetical protein